VGLGKEEVLWMPFLHYNKFWKKRREFNLPTYILFIDYEKTCDNVNWEKLWQILHDKNIPFQLQKAIQSLYKNLKVCIKYHDRQLSDPINTNKGVKQGCGLSPDLFNIYINKIIKEWKQTVNSGIQLNNKNKIQTILYADDQILITRSEDELQIAVNELNKIGKKYDMKISTSKTKSVGLCGKYIQRVKIVIDDKIIEQVSSFIYLGN
jgi:hypothetical protein